MATQQFDRFRGKAGIQQAGLQNQIYEYVPMSAGALAG
jgi:hypothetical protein